MNCKYCGGEIITIDFDGICKACRENVKNVPVGGSMASKLGDVTAYKQALVDLEAKRMEQELYIAEVESRIADLEKRAITWHDIKDGLPEKETTVLISTENKSDGVDIAYHIMQGEFVDINGRLVGGGEDIVTAWAEIPEPWKGGVK